MHIQIEIDTREEISPADRAVLSAILGQPVISDDSAPITVEKAPETEVEEKPAPKRRGRPRKAEPKEEEVALSLERKASRLKAEADKKEAELKEAQEEAEESAEETEDEGAPAVLEDDENAPTLEQAVSRATALISDGKAPAVKKVLNDLNVKKVGELSQSDIQAFLDGLEDA